MLRLALLTATSQSRTTSLPTRLTSRLVSHVGSQ